jgi:hypothetical protein
MLWRTLPEFFSEITISLSFTAEYTENDEEPENKSEDLNCLKTLHPRHFSAVIKTPGFLDSAAF